MFMISTFVFAQVDTLNVQEIQVVKSFVPAVPESQKIMDSPQFIDSTSTSKSVRYNAYPKQYNGIYEVDTLSPAKIKGEPLLKLYSTYLNLGLGNNSLPLISASYNTQRSKSLNYGGRFQYNESYLKVASSYDGEKISAANRQTDVSFFAKKITNIGVINANFSREGNFFQSYGYDPLMVDNTEQANQYWGYSQLNLSLESQHHRSDSLQFFGHLYLADLNESTENTIAFIAELRKSENDLDISLGLHFGVDFNNHAEGVDFSAAKAKEAIYTFMPRFAKTISGIEAKVGFNTSIIERFDSTGNITQFYPYLRVDYAFSDSYQSVFAGVRGGIRQNSMWSITKENPYVLNTLNDGDADLKLVNGSVVYDFFAGMRTKISSSIYFDAGLSYSREENMPFFELDYSSRLKNKFQVLYDDVNHLELDAGLKWDFSSNKGIYLDFVYHSYSLDSLATYAYKPTLESSFGVFYKIANKIVANAYLKTAFGRSHLANANDGQQVLELDDIIDLDLSLEYKYNKVISAYLKAQNLIGGYEVWENYSVLSPLFQFSVSYRY